MGENFIIEATKNTPRVNADSNAYSMRIEGSTFPENVRKFYDPITDWIDKYINLNKEFTIDCKFYYMASSSVIAFLKTLKKLESKLGKDNMKIIWRFEEGDDDILKIGEDYSQLLDITFSFKEEAEEH